jgi:hypothetical protein
MTGCRRRIIPSGIVNCYEARRAAMIDILSEEGGGGGEKKKNNMQIRLNILKGL